MKPIISVQNLSKRYKLGVFNAKTLREEAEAFLARFSRKKGEGIREKAEGVGSSLSSLHSPSAQSADFWALKDVSFDVQPGEVIGVIGRNGAGKSTLLKILSRITEPTSGEARIRGRVASLLEVGTGFHPELTGRENVFLNGAILGMTKAEIRSKFDEIVAFAEIEKFIDTPVKRYSSGMYVRLAFAVAAHLEPEILIVDEVLAVGDIQFQRKCLGKMKDVSAGGRTVLFVSHNMAAVKTLCSSAIYMSNGRILATGGTEEVVGRYLSDQHRAWADRPVVSSCGMLTVRSVHLDEVHGGETSLHEPENIQFVVEYSLAKQLSGLRIGYLLRSSEGGIVNGRANTDRDSHVAVGPGDFVAKCLIPAKGLLSGDYYLCIGFDAAPYSSSLLFLEDVIAINITQKQQVRETGIVSLGAEWKVSPSL
jgi:lipopolysaccharide transport system ATP-binding protein